MSKKKQHIPSPIFSNFSYFCIMTTASVSENSSVCLLLSAGWRRHDNGRCCRRFWISCFTIFLWHYWLFGKLQIWFISFDYRHDGWLILLLLFDGMIINLIKWWLLIWQSSLFTEFRAIQILYKIHHCFHFIYIPFTFNL